MSSKFHIWVAFIELSPKLEYGFVERPINKMADKMADKMAAAYQFLLVVNLT